MKKIVKRTLLPAAAAAMVTGCSRIDMGEDAEPIENSVYVVDDGGVRWVSMKTYQQGDYTEDELKIRTGQKISDFNSGLRKAVPCENSEDSGRLPTAMVSARIGNETATLVTEHNTSGRLTEFAREIGDYSVSFIQPDTGRVAVMSGELKDASFKDEKGKVVDQETILKEGQNLVVKATGQGVIVTEKKIQYASDGCTLKDSKQVQTSGKGTSYIILKQFL